MKEQYEYKGNLYTKLEFVEMKEPITRNWIIAVLYQNEHGEKFVRDVADFDRKFTKKGNNKKRPKT